MEWGERVSLSPLNKYWRDGVGGKGIFKSFKYWREGLEERVSLNPLYKYWCVNDLLKLYKNRLK
jgi:hypothetical protein